MTYVTTLSPQDFAKAVEAQGFEYVKTSDLCTTYRREDDFLSIEEPEMEVYEVLVIATDFRLSPEEMEALHAVKL